MFKYSLDNKRYHTLNYYYQNKYGSKVFKVSLNGNFTCPNLDGSKSDKGCIYCSKTGSGEYGGNPLKPLKEQFEEVRNVLDKKWPNSKYIVYFQARTNTYAPLNKLKSLYEEAISLPNVIGINVATRPDSISLETYDYLEELNKRTNLTIELGLQTIHDSTSELINRCHTLEEFEKSVYELKKRNINTVVHIINGLPYETKEMMLETVKYLNKLKIDGIKIHMLSILKGTELEIMYNKNPFHILTKEEYVDIVVSQLELLDENIVIHRITGDPDKNEVVEPLWLIKKFCVLNDIDKLMVSRNTYQGAKKEC
jgi:radical SAM protein (TIGR01212 family)